MEAGASSTSTNDTIATVIHGNPDPSRTPQYLAVVEAVCAPGKLGKGMTVGVEIAQRVEKVTDTPTMFLANGTGQFGAVTGVTANDDISHLEKAEAAFYSDHETIEFVDSATAEAYQPSGTQTIYRRLG